MQKSSYNIHMDKIDELLTRGVANIVPNKEELKTLLKSGKKLNIYLGIDPTATKIHLGHTVPLRKLQAFAEFKHNVTFLIGDFTALIGDTSDKDSERPMLSKQEIEINFQTYKKQAEKIVNFSLPNVRIGYNSEWLKTLTFSDVIQICQHFSLGDFIGRELIKRRLQTTKRVGLHEVLYPVMQGYDSYHLKTDMQIGGTDQTFNMQAGRTLIKDLENRESFILANEFLLGIDGKKMSKTGTNAIWIDDSANEMYGKIMAINDGLIQQYYRLATRIPLEKLSTVTDKILKKENLMELKKELAYTLVEEFHGNDAAQEAQEYFEKTVQKKELPQDMPKITIPHDTLISYANLLLQTGLASSKSDAKRLIEQGGVEVDNERITEPSKEIVIKDNLVIKVGKRKFVEIIAE